MHTTCIPNYLDRSLSEIKPESRLSWLIETNAREAHRRSLFRNAAEEEQMQLMSHPLPSQRAYELFGMLVGALPPAAIFARIFGYGFKHSLGDGGAVVFILCLIMNVVCCLAGRAMGSVLGRSLNNIERWSWSKMMLMLPLMGAVWGVVAGGAGGILFFGFGAVFGLVCAVPVGILAFTIFTPLHRLLARGGMIDARHFWPLACGTAMIASALILGL